MGFKLSFRARVRCGAEVKNLGSVGNWLCRIFVMGASVVQPLFT